MAEVEQRAVALLGLVAHDNIGLHLHRAAHRLQPQSLVALGQRGAVFLHPFKEIRIAKQPVFRHLAIASPEIAGAQRAEHTDIGQHQRGLVEGSDQVLAKG